MPKLPARPIIISAFALFLVSCSGDKGTSNVPSVNWETAIGSGIDEYATRLLLLPDGGILAAGAIASFSQTDADVYLVRTDYAGTKLWDRRFVTPPIDMLTDLAVSSTGTLLIAGWVDNGDATNYNALLMQVTMEGDLIRGRRFEYALGASIDDEAAAVLPMPSGGGFLVGSTQNLADSAGRTFLVRFDSTGEMTHQHVFGGPGSDVVNDAILAPDYTILIAGADGDSSEVHFDAALTCADTLGNIIWRRAYTYPGSSILNTLALDSDGSIVIAGSADTTGTNDRDFFIARADAGGQIIWSVTHGGRWADEVYAILIDNARNIVVTGSTGSFGAQATDAYIMKLDPNGQILWEHRYGEQSFDEAYDLVQAADSGYILAGSTRSIGAGGKDVYLIKTDADGNVDSGETQSARLQ